jgi:uncharacterized protein YggU (UPF0235/DUF167 family)
MRIVFDLGDAAEFHEKLSEFCDIYTNLGPEKPHRGYENEEKIQSESIFRENKHYFLDLKENHRGRFLKLALQFTPSNERTQVVIPAQGMVEIRDVLTDILNEYGKDDKKNEATAESLENTIVLNKERSFTIEKGENPRGKFVRINEVSGSFRTSVTVGDTSLVDFIALVEQAMSNTPDTDTAEQQDAENMEQEVEEVKMESDN